MLLTRSVDCQFLLIRLQLPHSKNTKPLLTLAILLTCGHDYKPVSFMTKQGRIATERHLGTAIMALEARKGRS